AALVRRCKRNLNIRCMFAGIATEEIPALGRGNANVGNHGGYFRNILSHQFFNRGDGLRRFFESRSDGILHRDGKDAFVLVREEFGPDKFEQEDGGRSDGKDADNDRFSMMKRPFERTRIGMVDRFDLIVEKDAEPVGQFVRLAVHLFFRRKEFEAEQRRDRPRNEERPEERHRNRERERNKEELRDARQEDNGKEYNDRRQRRNEDRRRDLARGGKRLLDLRFAGAWMVVMTADGFQFDNGIVHQPSYGQRQAAKRHDVQCNVPKPEHDERDENGHRDRDDDNDRTAKISQEDHDDRHGENRSDEGFPRKPVDRLTNIERLVEGERDMNVWRDSC